MKLHLLLFLLLLLSFDSFGQTRKGNVRTKAKSSTSASKTKSNPTAYAILADVKALTPKERKFCLDIFKSLDAADSVFRINGDAFRFFDDIKKIVSDQEINDTTLRPEKLQDALNLVILNYMDANVLIRLGATRHKDGTVKIDSEQAIGLGEMQRRYGTLIGVGAADDLLDPDTVGKIYASAINIMSGLYTYME